MVRSRLWQGQILKFRYKCHVIIGSAACVFFCWKYIFMYLGHCLAEANIPSPFKIRILYFIDVCRHGNTSKCIDITFFIRKSQKNRMERLQVPK